MKTMKSVNGKAIGMRNMPVKKASYQHVTEKIKNPGVRTGNDSFGQRLFYARMQVGMSRKDFADFIEMVGGYKVTAGDIMHYEKEDCCPKCNKQSAIEKALNLGTDYFEGATTKGGKYDFGISKKNAAAFMKALKK